MWRELRFAARTLRDSSAFTAASVPTIAVGVGATTALFTVVYGILLRPLPDPDPDALGRFAPTRFWAGQLQPADFSASPCCSRTASSACCGPISASGPITS